MEGWWSRTSSVSLTGAKRAMVMMGQVRITLERVGRRAGLAVFAKLRVESLEAECNAGNFADVFRIGVKCGYWVYAYARRGCVEWYVG